MPNKDELDVQWDANVIEFWQASLQSYKTCHDAEKPNDNNSETIASNLIDSLPKKKAQPKASVPTARNDEPTLHLSKPKEPKDQHSVATKLPPKRASHIEEKTSRAEATIIRKEHDTVSDPGLKLPEKRKASVELPGTDLPTRRRHVQIDEEEEEQFEDEQFEDEQYEEEQYEDQDQAEQEAYSYQNTSKKAKYQDHRQEYYYQDPHYNGASTSASTPAPPMPPSMPAQDNEAFSNLIMSWYYAGYYTGLYQSRQR
ncbi:hypothetical protein MBANPS3_011465 [Mucor bainieri]